MHGGRGEAREADHVARGVDVRDGRLEALVHGEEPPAPGREPSPLELEPAGVALAPDGVEEPLADHDLAALRGRNDAVRRLETDARDLLAEAKRDPLLT